MVKLTPPQQRDRLRELGTAIQPASGAWGQRGYTLVELAAVDRRTLIELVTDAWQNVMQAPAGRSTTKNGGARQRSKKSAKK